MIFTATFKVLNVKVKPWEIEGRKGTSHKAQIMTNDNEDLVVQTVKFDEKIKLEPNGNYEGQFRLTERPDKNFDVKLLSANEI